MDGPTLTIWGPPLWNILHALVERTGKKGVIGRMQFDEIERHAWFKLLDSLFITLPCPKCRNHYKQYNDHHPYRNVFIKSQNRNIILYREGTERREYLRTWLYTLHESVNIKKWRELYEMDVDKIDKYTPGILLKNIPEMYENYTYNDFKNNLNILSEQLNKGMRLKLYTKQCMERTLCAMMDLWNKTT